MRGSPDLNAPSLPKEEILSAVKDTVENSAGIGLVQKIRLVKAWKFHDVTSIRDNRDALSTPTRCKRDHERVTVKLINNVD